MGFSLRDVHAVTAIPLPCLAALEEGRLTALPSAVYARGYVRSYAEAVRLDGDRLALELWRCLDEAQVAAATGTRGAAARPARRPQSSAPTPGARPPRARRPINGTRPALTPLRQPESPWVPKPGRIRRVLPGLERVAIVLLALVLGVGIWDLERGRPSHNTPAPARASGVAAFPAPEPSSAPPPSPAPGTAAPVVPVATPSADNGSQATYTTGRDRFTVVVQATDAPCWMLVRATPGGPALFTGTLQPGESRPFDATGTLWVRVGNIGHASVLVEGTPLTLPDKPAFPYNLLLQR
ncbi:MAG: transcriptional regulator, family [Acidimicrobiales bacterium]|nr:transcriptional regulator, family [Acidimicrobiales bacterium]